jgi:hypothetical protein
VESNAILSDQDPRGSKRLNLQYRKTPLDVYRVEFTIEYTITPTRGFKATGCHGNKGVFCQIERRENMPVDAEGNSADIVMDPLSTINRMNPGTAYEQYLGSAARDVSKRVRALLEPLVNLTQRSLGAQSPSEVMRHLQTLPSEKVDQAYDYLLGFYQIVSPRMHHFYSQEITPSERLVHLSEVIVHGAYIYYPIGNEVEPLEVIGQIQAKYPPCYGPVSYVGNSGHRVTTERPVRIGPVYFMLLEKIADDWSSVSSGRLNHFGILSPMTRSEKHSSPFRNTAVKTTGETEARIWVGYIGREATAEMMDRSGNPVVHKELYKAILMADRPTDIDRAIDRSIFPLGGTKPLRILYHINKCSGYVPVYEPESL